ncbi:TPA: cytochrome B562 [Escherichia coli]|uniref:cytochrome b562 n=1 Tax=Escherichia coli TaxID=562 RepID=UPI0015E39FD9|nr:cytochrome b562 [Escherichia coli]EEW1561610.1 cytochrome B562 [Escherichia coli]MBA1076116.1 cytochrome B562 [Escherichia coli]MBM0449575.1 cytochrome B562 [Escherichia coli]HCN7084347.1 cytochrome B562 [Escherichia coli]HCN7425347.1 cytochrome B562 [Escherichia coli]
MIKQKVFFSGTVLAIFLSLSNVSLASGLDKNMQSLAKSMSILQSSNDKSSLLNALEMMDKSVDSSMNIIPEKIDVNDKVSVDSYKEELKKLQHEINIAKKKVEDGDIESLRESLDKMNDIKLEGHRKFR